ncbi:hypothetical protein [Pseudorhodobacter sp.]|uniref:hypothetical protein n=1 Tax=Pseudorhodobacter sp. TaxID=1934400 RepID=UPI0026483C4C|nr:hypothetical protein [Pseudorhodobacter sp.]MDN5787324.1 hypothetical protein [Pseudorhodobacter sp.]
MKAVLAIALLVASPVFGWTEPARGSVDRGAMMDALRPHIEWQLGGPVEFVIQDLRVDGRVGFAAVMPQRPGGGTIDIEDTPMAVREPEMLEFLDGLHIEALYEKSGDTWVVVQWVMGATDVWYVADELCAAYHLVIGDMCP